MRVYSASLSTKAKPVCLFFIIPIYYELYTWLLVPRHLGNCISNQQFKNFASYLVYSGQHWRPFSRVSIGCIHTSFVNCFSGFNFSQSPTRTEFGCLSILSKGVPTAMRFCHICCLVTCIASSSSPSPVSPFPSFLLF